MAITVQVARAVLTEQGFPADAVLLAAEDAGTGLAKDLAEHPDVAQIDYTGSHTFGKWLRANAATPLVYTEEAGVNSIVVSATDDFKGMCQNIAFSLALYSGQMCTAPQNIFIPKTGIRAGDGHKTLEEVQQGIAAAIDGLLADPARAAMVAGALANTDTLERVQSMRNVAPIVRDSAPIEGLEGARTATPLLLSVQAEDETLYGAECFGPIVFLVAVDSAEEGVRRAATLARTKGAITAALYETDADATQVAIQAFAAAGVNLSINLMGGIYVNQSAAFSDFHVTGANPAGNACVADAAFVANRFRVVMWRRPVTQ
jgi:phenylacetic acid degradation protein paaN